MNEIKCPNCKTVFQINEQDYDSIVKQIRDNEFERLKEEYKSIKVDEERIKEMEVSEESKKPILEELTGKYKKKERYVACYVLPYYTKKKWYRKYLKILSQKEYKDSKFKKLAGTFQYTYNNDGSYERKWLNKGHNDNNYYVESEYYIEKFSNKKELIEQFVKYNWCQGYCKTKWKR